MVLHVRAHYMCPLWNFLSPLLQSTWPLMHHLQQQRHHSGHRLLKHSSLLLYFSPLVLFEPLYIFLLPTLSFLHILLPVSSFSGSSTAVFQKLSTLSLPLPLPLSPFVFTQSRCSASPKHSSTSFPPIRWFPTSCNKAINLQHINQCRNVSLLTD